MRTYIDRRSGLDRLKQTLVLLATSATLMAGQSYYVATNGDDNTGNGSSGNPWKTLKHACETVAPDQDHKIRMKAGDFYDADRFTSGIAPATLPRNVSLYGAGKANTRYFGRINVPTVLDQEIGDFFLDGRENQAGTNGRYSGLMIENGSGLTVKNLRIEGFHSTGWNSGNTRESQIPCCAIAS